MWKNFFLAMINVCTVESCGRSGGLSLFYMDDPSVSVLYVDNKYISTLKLSFYDF